MSMHNYLNEQILCMETKPTIENSQHLSMASHNPVSKDIIYLKLLF
jgi:hypothetical protein